MNVDPVSDAVLGQKAITTLQGLDEERTRASRNALFRWAASTSPEVIEAFATTHVLSDDVINVAPSDEDLVADAEFLAWIEAPSIGEFSVDSPVFQFLNAHHPREAEVFRCFLKDRLARGCAVALKDGLEQYNDNKNPSNHVMTEDDFVSHLNGALALLYSAYAHGDDIAHECSSRPAVAESL
ncbi:hypothetical protein GC163_24555 [bacterium]|nr:hypothetical protein [bacterium]